jgi:KaiC/GvpD/RAD55 family RecA-like ATPase
LEVEACQRENRLRFVDAYSGGTGIVSSEKHSVPSPRDLTALGIQITSCLEEVGGVGDVFFDSLAPIVAAGDSAQAFNFVQYYGARIVKSGGTLLYIASTALEPELLSRFEEASDCVLQTERYVGPHKIRGRLLVKKARGLQHQEDWVGFRIASNGRMDFISLPAEKR